MASQIQKIEIPSETYKKIDEIRDNMNLFMEGLGLHQNESGAQYTQDDLKAGSAKMSTALADIDLIIARTPILNDDNGLKAAVGKLKDAIYPKDKGYYKPDHVTQALGDLKKYLFRYKLSDKKENVEEGQMAKAPSDDKSGLGGGGDKTGKKPFKQP